MGRVRKKQSMVKGAMILAGCMLFAKVLGIFFRVPMQHMIGDQGMGYYSMAFPLYTTFVGIVSGVPVAVSKMVAEFSHKKDYSGIRDVIRYTMLFMGLFAVIVSIVLILFSGEIVGVFKWHPNALYSFVVISTAPVLIVAISVLRGYFQGVKNTTPSGISQIIEQVVRVGVGVGLAWFLVPKGLGYAAAGAISGTVIGALVAVIYLLIAYWRDAPQREIRARGAGKNVIKIVLDNAIPISIIATFGTILGLTDSLIVPRLLNTLGHSQTEVAIMMGQVYGKATTLYNVPLALATAISATVVGHIAGEYVARNKVGFERKVNETIKISLVIALPAAIGLYILAQQVIVLIYTNPEGYIALKYLALGVPGVILAHSLIAVFQSAGKYTIPIKNYIIGIIVKVIGVYVLVSMPALRINGAVISTSIAYTVICLLCLVDIIRIFKLKLQWVDAIIKPACISLIMGICVYITYNFTELYIQSTNIACVLAIFVGVIVYGLGIIALRVYKIEDIIGRSR